MISNSSWAKIMDNSSIQRSHEENLMECQVLSESVFGIPVGL